MCNSDDKTSTFYNDNFVTATKIIGIASLTLFSITFTFVSQGDFRSQKEAAWAVTNFMSGGSVQQLATIVQIGVLKPFCDLLNSKDWKIVVVVMDGLNNIMQVTKSSLYEERANKSVGSVPQATLCSQMYVVMLVVTNISYKYTFSSSVL